MKKIAVGDLGEFWYGDYKEPFVQLEGAVPGYPQGVVLKADDGKLLCAYCGKTYLNVGAHAAKIHGLPAKEYKEAVGLLQKSALVSEQTRFLNTAHGLRLNKKSGWRPNNDPARLKKISTLGGRLGGHGRRTAEALNKTGRCFEQVLATGRAVFRENGKITEKEMRARGIGERIVNAYFGDFVTFRRRLGDASPNRAGQRVKDEDLIVSLRSLARDVGRSPSVSDMRRYGLHSRKAYEDHFGSWAEACRLAGLSALPTGGVSRAIDDQEIVSVLSAYALLGSCSKVSRRTRMHPDRTKEILARYGIAPINPNAGQEPERHQQMALAADLARSIAGWGAGKAAA